MTITAGMVKELREKTGVGMMKCKQALQEVNGDVGAAEKLLRKQGEAAAAKKADRATGEGIVSSYIHTGGKIGVLIEVNCETDFAARSDDFQELVRDLAMHVAAAAPRFVKRDEVTEADLEEEREIARDQALRAGKPEAIVDKIVDGKMEKFYAQHCLLEQPFVKDPDKTIGELMHEAVGRIGENMHVKRFTRYVLGEDN
ncbi:MAG: translation elongation factor Ts [Acidobacteria bacterium]|nr:translation elongation factor Ts [Acidobacteriota bacterium]NIM62991.1 translation elongation factor Ts [Acidobacteriota bacterium]NIO58365.1 translation elongation factor Ts [Acidobacteriota bacterium]NIQ29416.1 translation elongation factor Ts [Acidobacteriota bacterium]NIQ84039.1 translation elongation factor Ts [Acidobacteriota bacterium]